MVTPEHTRVECLRNEASEEESQRQCSCQAGF